MPEGTADLSIPAKTREVMPDDYDRWLAPAMTIDELRAMLKPYDADLMKAYEVSRAVNSVKNDTPECIEPITSQWR
jgi:putative SOS response-associated peptidase YedK